MQILGINAAYHESAACLLRDGALVAAAEEERFTRVKHAKRARVNNPDELPWMAVRYCLAEGGLAPSGGELDLSAVDHVAYSLLPEARYRANVEHGHPYAVPRDDFGSAHGEACFRSRCLGVDAKLRSVGFRGLLWFLDHHSCHAAQAFFDSPFESAAVLVVDGIGEFHSTTLYCANGTTIQQRFRIPFPHSVGFLWEKLCKFIGFDEYEAAKVMGLAAYGDPKIFARSFSRLIRVGSTLEVDDRVACLRNDDYGPLEQVFGIPRRTEPLQRVTLETQAYADVAAGLQDVTEEALRTLALEAMKTETDVMCLSGGVALNCVAVGRLLREGAFNQVFIPPAPHDAGTAIGATYYLHTCVLKRGRIRPNASPYLGPSFSGEIIRRVLDEQGIIYVQCDDVAERAAGLVAAGYVVAWFQGRMEFGPRALGDRSILADPRNPESVARLNSTIKHREPFRPFAPSVLEEEVREWFQWDSQTPLPARYMLATFKVRPERSNRIPAVLHVDGTARVHAVSEAENPLFHRLIKAFAKQTGVPMVLNTSFNDQEPIVCTPGDALRTFLRTGCDYLVIGDYVVAQADNAMQSPAPDVSLETYFEKLR